MAELPEHRRRSSSSSSSSSDSSIRVEYEVGIGNETSKEIVDSTDAVFIGVSSGESSSSKSGFYSSLSHPLFLYVCVYI